MRTQKVSNNQPSFAMAFKVLPQAKRVLAEAESSNALVNSYKTLVEKSKGIDLTLTTNRGGQPMFVATPTNFWGINNNITRNLYNKKALAGVATDNYSRPESRTLEKAADSAIKMYNDLQTLKHIK